MTGCGLQQTMSVLAKIPLALLFHVTALETAGTIFLCYALAVLNKHVTPWLPMISDCAVYPPERYPFRLGLVVAAVLIGLQVVLLYNADRYFSGKIYSLVLGVVASCCLAVLAVVSEKEQNTVHTVAAALFFVLYWINMIILNESIRLEHDQPSPLVSTVLRSLTTIVTGVALIAIAYMSPHWNEYQVYIAVCEWVAMLSIVLFNWTFALECTAYSLAEVSNKGKFEN